MLLTAKRGWLALPLSQSVYQGFYCCTTAVSPPPLCLFDYRSAEPNTHTPATLSPLVIAFVALDLRLLHHTRTAAACCCIPGTGYILSPIIKYRAIFSVFSRRV